MNVIMKARPTFENLILEGDVDGTLKVTFLSSSTRY